MKLAVFTVMMPEYGPSEAARLLSELGYDGVEWRVTKPSQQTDAAPSYWGNNRCTIDIATVDREARKLAALTRSAGLEVPSLGTYMGYRDLEDIEQAMHAAAEMGCPRIRVSPPRYERAIGYTRLFGESLTGYVEIQRLAQKHGVQACLEIHMGNICSSPSLAHRLVCNFDPRYIGVILDPGNMIYEGYEDWRMGMELLGPYLAHVHLKNTQWAAVGT
jgi:sugar phosphate isomerase/epimerase